MQNMKRVIATLMAAAVMTGSISVTAFADVTVTSISLEVESEIQVGDEYDTGVVDISTRSDRYTVGDMEFLNEGYMWEPADIPTLEVYIEAEEGYTISITKRDNIKVKGATCTKATRVDSQTIRVILELPSMKETVGTVDEATWSSATTGSWSGVYNAGYYEVKLYRDGKLVKETQQVSNTSYDFSSMMLWDGNYSYKVRAVNLTNTSNKSEWLESDITYIDEATATQFRTSYGSLTSGKSEPGVASVETRTGWIKDSNGWWYSNADGTYTTSGWQKIADKWYYFNSAGYMKTGWILWNDAYYYCDDTTGAMLVSTTTPDGFRVDSSGVWMQP